MKLPVVKRSFFLFFLCFLPLLSALAAPNQGTITRKIVEIMCSPIVGDSGSLGKIPRVPNGAKADMSKMTLNWMLQYNDNGWTSMMTSNEAWIKITPNGTKM